jgi:putative component of toxin-antitoxin plasmid stabilization module
MTEDADRHFVLFTEGGRRFLGVVLESGACPTLDFLNDLSPKASTKMKATIEKLIQDGQITNREIFRKLQIDGQPAVWEMKVHEGPGYRLFCIQSGTDWYATHGCRKPSDRRLPFEVGAARKCFGECV